MLFVLRFHVRGILSYHTATGIPQFAKAHWGAKRSQALDPKILLY